MNKAEQIAALQTEVHQLKGEVEVLQKDVAREKSTSETWYKASQKHDAELEEVHALLDSLPAPIPRLMENGYTSRSLIARLASWFISNQVKG